MTKEKQAESLRKALDLLNLSAPRAAELFGVHSSRISNILRRQSAASSSSLDQELAFKIQAATGISAASLMNGDKEPMMLNGKPVNQESFKAWQELEIDAEAKEAQAGELSLKVRLLLDASDSRGNHLRRRTYHLLRSLLEEMRKEAGVSMSEIHEAARGAAKLGTFTATREELDGMIGQAPAYQAMRSRLPAKGLIQVVEETFPTWADLPEDLLPEVLDSVNSQGRIYRLQAGDAWFPVYCEKVEAKGKGSEARGKKLQRKKGRPIKVKP
jgi:plasmid maintenance system antidote protein VapI